MRAFYKLLDGLEDTGSEDKPLKLGNVEFWKDKEDWCYNIPKRLWNIQTISRDMVLKLKVLKFESDLRELLEKL